jgi:hypothetical protein
MKFTGAIRSRIFLPEGDLARRWVGRRIVIQLYDFNEPALVGAARSIAQQRWGS